MSNTWICYSNELFHFNPYHDPKTGQFTENPRGSRLGRYFVQNIKDGKDKPNTSAAEKTIKNTKQGVENARDITVSAKNISQRRKKRKGSAESKARSMSDDELRKSINRLELERRYDSLTSDDVSYGFDQLVDVLSIVGGIVGIAGGAASTYAVLKAVKG